MGSDRDSVLPRVAPDALSALALLALPWLLYGAVLDLWWTHDDFFQLRFTADYAPAEYLLRPEVWRLLPNRVLSPLLFASYDLDLAMAGLDPGFFYGHQLLSLGLAAVALYGTLRLWLRAAWAFPAGAAFLLGPPVAALAPLLMARHYLEALALALLSAAAFVAAARRRGWPGRGLAALSGALYLAASLAKEIAVPLPALLVLLPAGTLRRRLAVLAPHAGALAAYSVYRVWMLGTPLGGYGWAVLPGDWPRLALRLPGKIARELAGPSPWGWMVLAALAGSVLLLAHRTRRAAVLTAVGLLAVLVPVLPVATEVAPRYAAAAWILLVAAFAPAARLLARDGPRQGGRWGRRHTWLAVALVFLLATALAANRAAWSEHHDRAARMSAENLGLVELSAGELLRHPVGPPASMVELCRFARELLDRPAEGDWFYDDLFLCQRRAPVRSLWTFDSAELRLKDITGELAKIRRSHCKSIHWEAPLEAAFRRRGEVLTWQLGPYPEDPDGPEGGYAFLLGDGRSRYDVPRRGAFQVGDQALLGLRVRFQSPEGWVTYSPPLNLGTSTGPTLHWSRP